MADRAPLAIVGGGTLLGRELRDVLTEAGYGSRIRHVAGGEPAASPDDAANETAILEVAGADPYADALAVLLAGSPLSSRKALKHAGSRGLKIIDLTGALEDRPAARLRAPSLEEPHDARDSPISVIAHPAASALARFLRRLHRLQPVRSAVVTVFEPASERGQAGLDELHQQTVRLLSFQSLPKDVFDAQIGYNLLSAYGEDAPLSLASVEQRIERVLATLLAWGAAPPPMPSLRVVQAPVFHGYSFSAWVEFEAPADPAKLAKGLAGAGIEVRADGEEPPTNAGSAGQSGIAVGSIARDRNRPAAAWFWIVADNLRLTADHALEVVREIAL